jgi:hypothetical protein
VESHGGGQGSHAKILWNVSILQIYDTSLGKLKALQVKDDKVITEYIFSMIDQIISLTGKYMGGGIGYPTRIS